MKFLLFVTIVHFAPMSTQPYGLLLFRKDNKILSKCIENRFNPTWFSEKTKIRKAFIDNVLREFSWHTWSIADMDSVVTSVIDDLMV